MSTFYHIYKPIYTTGTKEELGQLQVTSAASPFKPELPQQLVHLPPLLHQLFHHGSCEYIV